MYIILYIYISLPTGIYIYISLTDSVSLIHIYVWESERELGGEERVCVSLCNIVFFFFSKKGLDERILYVPRIGSTAKRNCAQLYYDQLLCSKNVRKSGTGIYTRLLWHRCQGTVYNNNIKIHCHYLFIYSFIYSLMKFEVTLACSIAFEYWLFVQRERERNEKFFLVSSCIFTISDNTV